MPAVPAEARLESGPGLAIVAQEQYQIDWLQTLVPGVTPPYYKAFETDLFLYTRDAIALFKQLGFIGGKGTYQGRDAVLAATGPMAGAIIQKAPNNASSTVAFTGYQSFGGERP